MSVSESNLNIHNTNCLCAKREVLETIVGLVKAVRGQMGEGEEQAHHIIISTFIFLRFICPALVSPELYYLTKGC